MNLFELQNKIHKQNVELGWWDEERPFSTFVCLFHSELSEAMEGDRKGLMDDHLPKYEMFQVELADFVIRCMDFLGSVCKSSPYESPIRILDPVMTATEIIAFLHFKVSEAYMSDCDGFWSDRDEEIIECVYYAFEYSSSVPFDLHQIILEKVEYNRTRADHKRENRQGLPGQKKY